MKRDFYGESEVNDLNGFQVVYVIDNNVTRFHISMNIVKAVNVLETQKDSSHNFSTLLIRKEFILSTTSPLNEVGQSPAPRVLNGQDDVVREFSNLKLRKNRLT